jgi:multiple antibiotic resistance protein
MSDELRLIVAFIVAVNPPAVALALRAALPRERWGWAAPLAVGVALALACYLAAVLTAGDFMDFLQVAPESFRMAAGLVMLVAGAYAVWRGRVAAAAGDGRWTTGIFPAGIPLLAGPAALAAAISYGQDEGAGGTFAAAAIAVGLAALLTALPPGRWHAAADGLARLLGALLVVVAAGLMVEGERDI